MKIIESYLITAEDFVNMQLAKEKYQTPKENSMILRILGVIAVLCGIAAFMNVRNSLYQVICWILLIFIGLAAISYYDIINPYLIQKQAEDFFELNSSEIASKTVIFTEEEFELSEENHKIKIPKNYIYCIAESKNMILIFFDQNEFSFIPKRVFSEEQLDLLREYLPAEKYKKLGEV